MRSTYRIGPVRVTLATSEPRVAAAYDALYAPFRINAAEGGTEASFEVRVLRRRSRRTGLSHYHITSDVDDVFTVRKMSRVLPHVEGAVNLCIARFMPRYLLLHAAAMTRDGVGVIIPGGPGFGKTTLAAALTSRGWRYASDEFAMIDGRDGSIVPYPKALSIKSGSFDVLKSFGLPVDAAPTFDRADKGAIRLLPACAIRPDAIASATPIRLIVFPSLMPDAAPVATPMSQAESVFEMSRRCFNLLRFRSEAISLLSRIAKSARSERLQSGDLETTCRIMDRLAESAATHRRRPSKTVSLSAA
ncbi:MAG: hypothetical protein H6819_03795 [Phycisphaerales bacterium]|nr:hypothetical protein [Phycisphaerales bacterium]MCB9856321.1 hypothetical protein [Phycisphaerales bacterium]